MNTRGAIIRQAPTKENPTQYEIVDLELDEPRHGELMVKMVASGLCHSDDHFATGDMTAGTYPFCGGHEGAGVVVAVGESTPGWEEGDHVVFSFIPACGRCRWCASGRQNLCDLGAWLLVGCRWSDGSFRMSLDGVPVGQNGGISTFSEYTTVAVESCVKVDKDLPLDRLCLLGCGVGTGWGSAVNSAAVAPGHVVIVMGVGGIGINAVQGASHAGAEKVIAVDPVAFKRETALKLGATDAFDSIEAATEFAKQISNGQGADSVIITVGVLFPEHVGQALAAVRKAGTVVLTGVGDMKHVGAPISLSDFTLHQKRLQGSLFGECSPTADIPRQIRMYRDGRLRLDELVTATYSLDTLNVGYADMHAGKNIRGIITF